MRSRRFLKTFLVAGVLLTLLCVAAFAQKPPVNAKGQVISIAAIEFIQFQPYKVRVEAEKRAAADYGVKLTILQPPGVDGASHAETILNALNQNFDALIIENDWPGNYDEAIALAQKKGIILVDVHVPNPDKSKFISQITIDNEGYGVTAADKLGEITGGKANVLFLLNSPDIPNQATQRQSFIDRCEGEVAQHQGRRHPVHEERPRQRGEDPRSLPQGQSADRHRDLAGGGHGLRGSRRVAGNEAAGQGEDLRHRRSAGPDRVHPQGRGVRLVQPELPEAGLRGRPQHRGLLQQAALPEGDRLPASS